MVIKNYDDFVASLLDAGFSMGGGNSEGIFSVITWSWNEDPPYETPVRWHTGDPETDPWEWRIRVLEGRDDIACAKLFFNKSGYITKEWYPYFLAVRRGGRRFMDEYEDGKVSYLAKKIYDIIIENGVIPLHAIKQAGGFSKEDSSRFDRALVELQMKMFVTLCGRRQKVSKKGEEYGWYSTVFCTVERFLGEDVIKLAETISEREAVNKKDHTSHCCYIINCIEYTMMM
ncbi:MAG TPA: hypothetical protein GX501_03965 [Clostridiaceae bacterium]|nr:hypothetical protein [Clostridiaceae bacterium]